MIDRKIPATMATQHPDNASAPYWESDGDGFVNTREEVEECFSAFSDLGCQEFMWDWEGKHVDEAVVDRLFTTYHNFFKKKQLGRDIFLTYRLPNIWQEKGYSLARAYMTILTSRDFGRDLGFARPPIFEVILPMCDSARKMIYIQKTFTHLAHFKTRLFNQSKEKFDYVNIMPLIEGIDVLTRGRVILRDYLRLHQSQYKFKLEHLRPHIARSDPALNSGLVAAVVSAKIALSEYYRFAEDFKVKVFPAIGVGSLPFRGGLSPDTLDEFLAEYPGVRTVYIQSAFRYDFPLKRVKAAIARLNQRLSKTHPKIFSSQKIKEGEMINKIFSRYYRKTVERIAGTINRVAHFIPSRRERKLHIGLFGYSRGVGKKRLPRAIPFTGALYTLGVPPELIGTGRGLRELQKLKKIGSLGNFYFNLEKDLIRAGSFLNKENLEELAKREKAWQEVQNDVELIEEYLGKDLGPSKTDHFIHRNLTSSCYLLFKRNRDNSREILEAAKIRRSLG